MSEIQTNSAEQAIAQNQAEKWVNRGYKGSVLMIVLLSAAYTFLPIDLIPDFLLGAGQVDDLATILAGGGTVGFISVLRSVMIWIVQRPRLRTGCLIFFAIGSVILVIFSLLAFYGLYQLVESL